MKPLVVSLLPRPPHPTRDGGAIRNYQLLAGLSERFQVRALALGPPGFRELPWEFPASVVGSVHPTSSRVARLIRTITGSLQGEPVAVAPYRSASLSRELTTVIRHERPVWVVAHGFHVGAVAIDSGMPAWVDLHNIESAIWSRMATTGSSRIIRLATRWQEPVVRRHESLLVSRAAGVSVVSTADCTALEELGGPVAPLVISNGVDLERYTYRSTEASEPILAFVGDLRWRPNADAITWFHQEVWPALRERSPTIRVEVLGRGPSERLRRLQDERFLILGDEPDTRPLWRRAAVGIVPLRAGGGTRLKILEAAAMGVPVLSTTVGAEGLELEPEREIVIRDDPGGWVELILTLMSDPGRRRAVADRARARVEAEFSWSHIRERFADALAERAESRDT